MEQLNQIYETNCPMKTNLFIKTNCKYYKILYY